MDLIKKAREEFIANFGNRPRYRKDLLGDTILYPADFIESSLKQSFIKFLQEECERLNGEMFADPAQAGQFALHSSGYNQALEDIVYHYQNMIKELHETKKSN